MSSAHSQPIARAHVQPQEPVYSANKWSATQLAQETQRRETFQKCKGEQRFQQPLKLLKAFHKASVLE